MMKKPIYITLLILAIVCIGYTLYVAHTNNIVATPIQATSATDTASTTLIATTVDPSILRTSTGKEIKITETNPSGESLSTITITSSGLGTNTPITLETNKLVDFFVIDMNKDSYDELVLITQSQGSGSYGEATIFTTASDTMLTPVSIPEIQESDISPGKLFEGYRGHDSFIINDSKQIVRAFPSYAPTDPNSSPTGPVRMVVYNLIYDNNSYSIVFTKGTSTGSVASPLTSSTTSIIINPTPSSLLQKTPALPPTATTTVQSSSTR